MSVIGRLKNNWKADAAKLKGKPFKDKIWYIWEYYKFHIIGLVVGICLVASISSAIYSNRFPTALSCMVINSRTTDDGTLQKAYFDQGFRHFLKLDKNTVIAVDTSMSLGLGGSAISQFDYASLAKITAMTAGHDLDVMIGDPASIGHFGTVGALMDLKQTLPPDLYAKVKGQLFTATTQDGQQVACGVRLASTTFEQKSGLLLKDPVFSLVNGSSRIGNGIQLLRYILQQ